jgi:hypothetical protein
LTIQPISAIIAIKGVIMYSVKEAATKIGLSERHLRLLLKEGKIEGRKLGHDWVVLSLDYKRKRRRRVK